MGVAMKPAPRVPVVCAWCQRQLAEGEGPVSHGICADCTARLVEEFSTPPRRGKAGTAS